MGLQSHLSSLASFVGRRIRLEFCLLLHSTGSLINEGSPFKWWPFFSVIELKMTAPSMKERQVCWGARDDYWKCLDENSDDASKCKKLRSIFESSCPQQWIKHFDKRRDYLKFKEKFEAGQFEPSERTATS
ncbi:cytochrome c oxidase assembly factor 6 homolog isoform X1 [Notamacropus eugenii]|uniref:cytochrome c oxidase assembly factor 6 homolog isoform X1 n=2 Tax=Notamacropus eugenii TaxID=9315 RepID=UPI003B670C40